MQVSQEQIINGLLEEVNRLTIENVILKAALKEHETKGAQTAENTTDSE